MFYIKPVKQEFMYLNPTISIFHDVLTPTEMVAVRRLARPRVTIASSSASLFLFIKSVSLSFSSC